jgi:hypothetical protein
MGGDLRRREPVITTPEKIPHLCDAAIEHPLPGRFGCSNPVTAPNTRCTLHPGWPSYRDVLKAVGHAAARPPEAVDELPSELFELASAVQELPPTKVSGRHFAQELSDDFPELVSPYLAERLTGTPPWRISYYTASDTMTDFELQLLLDGFDVDTAAMSVGLAPDQMAKLRRNIAVCAKDARGIKPRLIGVTPPDRDPRPWSAIAKELFANAPNNQIVAFRYGGSTTVVAALERELMQRGFFSRGPGHFLVKVQPFRRDEFSEIVAAVTNGVDDELGLYVRRAQPEHV